MLSKNAKQGNKTKIISQTPKLTTIVVQIDTKTKTKTQMQRFTKHLQLANHGASTLEDWSQ